MLRATVLLLLALPAYAETQPPAHFHVLTKQLTQRLDRSAKKRFGINLESVGIYRHEEGHVGGTAYLVTTANDEGVALMLTNHHVALNEDGRVSGDMIDFHIGGDTRSPIGAQVLGTVLKSKTYDYALLRVQLPEPLLALAPVKLERRATFELGERVYNPSFPRFVEGQKRIPKRLQVGWVNGGEYDGLVQFFLPNRVGSSGSPVFSRSSNALVGMMNAGSEDSLAFVRPMASIVNDIESRLDAVPDHERARVTALVSSVR